MDDAQTGGARIGHAPIIYNPGVEIDVPHRLDYLSKCLRNPYRENSASDMPLAAPTARCSKARSPPNAKRSPHKSDGLVAALFFWHDEDSVKNGLPFVSGATNGMTRYF